MKESDIPLSALEETYNETTKSDDEEIRSKANELADLAYKWNSLWCLVRSVRSDEEMSEAVPFLDPFAESCRDAVVACSLALHGCYKQAKEVLRNCLELLVLAGRFSTEPAEYDKWHDHDGYEVDFQESLVRVASSVVMRHDEKLVKQFRGLRKKLNQAIHSSRRSTEVSRMLKCEEDEYCPIIRLAFLPVDLSELKRILGYMQELLNLAGILVTWRFPEVGGQNESVLRKLFHSKDVKCLRSMYIELTAQGDISEGMVTEFLVDRCFKERAKSD